MEVGFPALLPDSECPGDAPSSSAAGDSKCVLGSGRGKAGGVRCQAQVGGR